MNTLWKGRKRVLFLGLPLTFTSYTLLEDKFLVDSGFFTSHQEEIRLYRIIDISLTRTFFQKIFGLGTITCDTSDKSCPKLEIINIRDVKNVKELLSQAVENERIKKRVSSREFMHSEDMDDDLDDDYR